MLSGSRLFVAALGFAAIGAAACSAPADEDTDQGEDAVRAAEGDFYGNDRVGALLKGHPEKIPATFDAYEAAFGVGRKCKRVDSKEIFVVEESQTRLEDGVHAGTKLMPRAVITGCNIGDLSDPASARISYGLMAALISDPDMHQSAQGDTMRLWPVEVMALDEKTGLYNFYVFEPAETPQDPWAVVPASTRGKVTRVYRENDSVFRRSLVKGETPTAPSTGGGKACFNCHVNGAPLMNELRDPWTNWVSFKAALPVTTFSGTTKELVSESVPNASAGRASLANDLEPIMRLATQEYVFGGKTAKGWARGLVAGEQPGGIARALESVFCQTELNYGSAGQLIPMELWLDPDAVASAEITPPASYGSSKTPFQFPVRSVYDKETESFLIQAKYLKASTVMAIRLFDDENDIFSTARCGLLPEITKGLTADPAKVLARIQTVLTSKLATLPFKTTQPKRAAYIKALLATPAVDTDAAEAEYLAELTTRFAAVDKTEATVAAKTKSRHAQAKKMFPSPSNPLPVLDGE